jgi:hypothetical protein
VDKLAFSFSCAFRFNMPKPQSDMAPSANSEKELPEGGEQLEEKAASIGGDEADVKAEAKTASTASAEKVQALASDDVSLTFPQRVSTSIPSKLFCCLRLKNMLVHIPWSLSSLVSTGVGTKKHNVKSFFLWNDVVVQLA